MLHPCPKCHRELPKNWDEKLTDGIFVHSCQASLEPAMGKRWSAVLGVVISIAFTTLLAFFGIEFEYNQFLLVIIAVIFGTAVVYYGTRPILICGRAIKHRKIRRIA